jgi:hypothetical protein
MFNMSVARRAPPLLDPPGYSRHRPEETISRGVRLDIRYPHGLLPGSVLEHGNAFEFR